MRMSRRLANGAGSYQFYDYIGNTLMTVTQYSRPLGNQPYIPTGVTAKKIRLYGNVYIDKTVLSGSDTGALMSAEMLRYGKSNYLTSQMGIQGIGVDYIYAPSSIARMSMNYTQGSLSDAWHLINVSNSIDIASAGSFTHKFVCDSKTTLNQALGAYYPGDDLAEVDGAEWSLFSFAEAIGSSDVECGDNAFAGRMQTMRIYDADTGTQLVRLHPCKRVVDGALGMYDEISGVFHEARNGPNAGTTFYVGNL